MCQRDIGEGKQKEVPLEEKVKKVGNTIIEVHAQVYELHLNIKLATSPKERERLKKVNEESSTLQELSTVEKECDKWYKVSLIVYEKLLTTPEIQDANKQVQDCDQRSLQLRASMMTLPLDACRLQCKKMLH